MAIMWHGSLIPWLDPSANPYSGARAYFFNAGTTTPRTVYQDSALGNSHDHPVLANASGMFPAVFLPSGSYRLRITDADGATVWDVDGISTPAADVPIAPEGDTPLELLARTGDYKFRHDTGSHSGWVRANGRTIGNASSGATERANADCEALFTHLWSVDSTLTVAGGRGPNAASDWAAAKTIALPDFRSRTPVGLANMGNTALTLIPDALIDGGETASTLGATLGAAQHTLTTAQMPSHTHTGTTSTDGAHSHSAPVQASRSSGAGSFSERYTNFGTTGVAGAHSHTVNLNTAGNGEAHPNMQPSALATFYIKL